MCFLISVNDFSFAEIIKFHGACFVIPTSCRWHLVQSFCIHPCPQASLFPRLDTLHGDCFVIPTSCRWHLVQSFDYVCPLKRAWTFKPCQSLAERRGFEPRKPFWSLHAFQACLFNHSSISPLRFKNAFSVIGYKITAFLRHTQEFGHFFAKKD